MSSLLNRLDTLSPKRLALLALELEEELQAVQRERTEPIAIIGIGCRIPGNCNSPEAYWKLLDEGRDAVSEVPRDRWDNDEYFDADPDAPGMIASRWGGFLGAVDGFDAPFFGISRREAMSMDPQQRMVLEVAWEALEHAGISPHNLHGTATGVYLGISTSDYYGMMLARGQESIDAYLATGTAHSVAAGRIAYFLGLQGPNFPIDTACSSSLVAVHTAVQSLRNGECKLAMAGGVNAILSPDITIALSKSHMMAPDGRCKAFDWRADGFVRGEGCGIVVLKRLSDALGDGDNVLALIRGSALNQDGRSSGITAPNGASQEAVIRQALANAGVKPEEIDYVETHGTGTSLGDPIEAHALASVLGNGRSKERPLVVGSVKTNLGHLESAAGIAGLIKVVLSLEKEKIPAHLHFERMNPHIDWKGVEVEIPVKGREWKRREGKRRVAGVSSFGFSGTNAHIVLEEAPVVERAQRSKDRGVQVLALSARTASALETLRSKYADSPSGEIEDICYTANAGRAGLTERLVLDAETEQVMARGRAEGKPEVVFVFTGQGAQYVGMGRELYETEPVFREVMDRCAAAVEGVLKPGLLDVLYGSATGLLDDTTYTQPAGYALQVALAAQWRSWGVEPSIVLGHSVGEYAASAVAGLYTVEDGMRLITERGRLTGGLEKGQGAMAVILAPRAEVEAELGPWVSVAAYNGPENIVISGRTQEVEAICAKFTAIGKRAERLRVSHGFHSPCMAPIEEAFERFAAGLEFQEPRVTVLSTVLGRAAGVEEMGNGRYWRKQVRGSVHFDEALRKAAECEVFVEIGPGSTVLGMGRELIGRDTQAWLPSIRRSNRDNRQMAESLSEMWVRGVEVNWDGYYAGRGCRRVPLPTYPFEHQKYWLDTRRVQSGRGKRGVNSLLGSRVNAAVPIYEGAVDLDAAPWIRDHRVAGTSVVPAAAWLDIALSAAKELSNTAPVVTALELCEPLRIDAAEPVRKLQTVIMDGSFRMFSLTGERWTLHATGRLETAITPEPYDFHVLRQRATKEQDVAAFYDALAARKIDLGPESRSLRRLWSGDHEAFAELSGTGPAALDACFQVIGAAVLFGLNEDVPGTYVLRHVGSYCTFGALDGRLFAHARVERDPSRKRVLGAELSIFSESGSLLAKACGVGLSLLTMTEASIDVPAPQDWFYRLKWQEQPLPSAEAATGGIATDARTLEALNVHAVEYARANAFERYDLLKPELDRVCNAYIGRALANSPQPVERHRRLYERIASIKANVDGDPDSLCDALLASFPEYGAELALIRRCGSRLREVLEGSADPLELLTPGGSFENLEQLYIESPSARTFNSLASRALAAALERIPADQPLRILEIGAGTGGTTTYLSPLLKGRAVEYTFSDVSPLFLARARERFKEYEGLRYAMLDIEHPGEGQPRFDVIVAANVLHATADLRSTLRNVRNLLKDSGLLLLIEGTRPELWVDITFGCTEGWWKFTDADLRPQHALLNREQWIAVLGETGFRASSVAPQNSQQVLFLAEALPQVGEASQEIALFDARTNPSCAAFAEALRTAGTRRLWAVTSGMETRPEMAALWGVARTASLEHPDKWGGIIDVSEDADAAALVACEVRCGSDEDQVLYRNGVRCVPRLVRDTAVIGSAPRLRGDGVYVITGGTGNLGIKVAEWMVLQGARELILTSRSAKPSAATEALKEHGARVDVVAADITADVETLRAAIGGRKVRGIVHAAAVFDSTLLDEITPAQFDAVLKPKAEGARQLLALCDGVDFLVLFSSTTALLGVRGMAAYAAANAWLDAFAQEARERGIPAVSVNWGTWDQLGRASAEDQESYRRSGLHPMPSAQALSALGSVLGSKESHAVVASIDWNTLKPLYESRRRRPMLELVSTERMSTTPTAEVRRHLQDALAEIPPADRLEYVINAVREEAAGVLGLKPDEVDTTAGLFEMGMDSLMSIELKRRLELRSSQSLPSTLTFNYPNVEALARYIYDLIAPTAQAQETEVEAVRDEREDLSEDELATLLLQALKTTA